jgi:hypothetical protein
VPSRLLPVVEARQSGDPELRAFAEGLDQGALIADLREARIGSGFAWGRYGPQTQVQRAGSQLLFAITPPERARGAQRGVVGFFARPLGRQPAGSGLDAREKGGEPFGKSGSPASIADGDHPSRLPKSAVQ